MTQTSLEAQENTLLRGNWLHIARAVWVLVALLALGILIVSIPGYAIRFSAEPQIDAPAAVVDALLLIGNLASILAALTSLSLAGLLFWRKSDERIVLTISLYLLVYAVVMAGPMEAIELLNPAWERITVDIFQPVLMSTPTMALLFLFPNGILVPRWSRWAILVSLLWVPFMPSVFSESSDSLIVTLVIIFWILSVPVLGLYAQVYRYRHLSTPSERQQTKWPVFGFTLWILVMIVSIIPWFTMGQFSSGEALPWWFPVTSAVWWLSLMIIPVTLSIAVLRTRLWDIDIIIRRTLVYSVLSVALASVYFGSVVALQVVVTAIGGQQEALVTVISTLASAALFTPLRRRVQDFIDRRFFRRKYDAEQTLAAFAATVRDYAELERLSESLLTVVQETMQPVHVSLWLKETADSRPQTVGTLTDIDYQEGN